MSDMASGLLALDLRPKGDPLKQWKGTTNKETMEQIILQQQQQHRADGGAKSLAEEDAHGISQQCTWACLAKPPNRKVEYESLDRQCSDAGPLQGGLRQPHGWSRP